MAIMVIYEYKIFGEVFMSKLLEEIKHGVDVTIPEMEDLNQVEHPKIDYTLYILRNIFVVAAAVLFLLRTLIILQERFMLPIKQH